MEAVDPVEEEWYDKEEELPPIRLTEGIELKDLIDSSSAVFQVNVDDFPEEEEDLHVNYFDNETALKCCNFDCIDADDDDGISEPGRTPFEKLAAKMVPITEDGKVKKKLVQPGMGSEVPEGAHVIVHYSAYVEYGDDPYDSTRLRGFPARLKINDSLNILGLDVAIRTMKQGEASRFLIHPDMAYGRFGCPPRIPPNAELLFDIELINYFDNAAAEAFEALSVEERKTKDFDYILKVSKAHHVAGNELFKKGHYSGAIAKYKKAVQSLERCHMKNEEEEKQQQSALLKLYCNLALCYNKQNLPKMACIMSKNALKINPMCAKALFNFGRALIILSDYKEAQRRLLAAKKIEPNDKKITEELKKLEKKKVLYSQGEKLFSQRAFSGKTSSTEEKSETKKAQVTEDFEEAAQILLQQFLDEGAKGRLPLPTGLTFQEEFCIRQKAEPMGLIVRTTELNGERQLFLANREE